MELSKIASKRSFSGATRPDPCTSSQNLQEPLTPMPKLAEYLRRYSITLNFSNFSLQVKKKIPIYTPCPRPSSLLLKYLSLPQNPPRSLPNLKPNNIKKNRKSNTDGIPKSLQSARKKVPKPLPYPLNPLKYFT